MHVEIIYDVEPMIANVIVLYTIIGNSELYLNALTYRSLSFTRLLIALRTVSTASVSFTPYPNTSSLIAS